MLFRSTLNFKEPFKRVNKEKSNDLTVNDLQHEINIIKQEISELKHKNRNINPELIMIYILKHKNRNIIYLYIYIST